MPRKLGDRVSKNWTIAQSVNRCARKLLSVLLCGTLFSTQMTFVQAQSLPSPAILKKIFQASEAANEDFGPATTMALKNIEIFVRQYTDLEKNPPTLYQRITEKLSGFSEGFLDTTQNYDNVIAKMASEAQLLGEALYNAHILRKSIQDYLLLTCTPEDAQDCVPPEDKYYVLANYANLIYLPMRSLALIMMDHRRQGKSYLELADGLIDFILPAETFNYSPDAIIGFEENGLFGGAPLALKVIAQDDGTYRLQHDPQRQLGRDISLIIQAPASMTYMRALKWMGMKSLLSQIELSKNLLKDSGEIPIPSACRNPENANLPPSIPIKQHPLLPELEFPRMLMNHGLMTSVVNKEQYHLLGINDELLKLYHADYQGDILGTEELNQALIQFNETQKLINEHLDYLVKIPNMGLEQGDMYGILPFEQVEKADFALHGRYGKKDEPYFDDLESFDFIYSKLMEKALNRLAWLQSQGKPQGEGKLQEVRESSVKSQFFSKVRFPYGNYPAPKVNLSQEQIEFFIKSVTFWAPGEEPAPYGNKRFTQWLVELRKRHGSKELMGLLHPNTVLELKNRTIKYGFAPYYSSANMKRFSLEELLEGLQSMQEKQQQLSESGTSFLGSGRASKDLRKLLHVLINSPFYSSSEGESTGLGELIDRVISLLDPYSDAGQSLFFPHKSVANESLKKAWPSLRKIYEMLVEEGTITPEKISEYDYIEEQIDGGSIKKNPWVVLKLSYYLARQELQERWGENSPILTHYDSFIRPLGLHLWIRPFFAQKVLAKKKDRKEIWELIQRAHDAQNNFIFRTPVRSDPGHHYYDLLQYVATTPVITKERFYQVSKDLFLQGNYTNKWEMNWWEYEKRADTYFDDILFRSADDLYQIYTTEDLERKEHLMMSYIERYDIQVDYSPKRHFLQADFYSKYLIYHQLLLQAVNDHKLNLQERLKETCLLTHDKIENYRHSFHTLASEQQLLNQQYGLEELPKAVQDKVDSMDSRDLKIMKFSGGFMGGLLLSFAMISAGCVFTAGIGCALAFGVIVGGTGLMGVEIFRQTTHQYFEAQDMVGQMAAFKDIGMANQEGIDEVHHTAWWMAIEGVLMLPLVNFFAKFTSITGRAFMSWGKSMVRGNKKSLSNIVQHAAQANAEYEALYVLGFISWRTELKELFKGVKHGAKNLFNWMLRRNTVVKGMGAKAAQRGFQMTKFQHIKNLPGKDKILEGLQQTLEGYFKGDLKHLHRTLVRYRSKKKLAKYQRKLAKHLDAPQTRRHKGRVKKMRKLIDFQLRLHRLVKNLDNAIARGDSFTSFVGRNVDNLMAFKYVSMKLREIPHMFLMQGGPMTRSRIFAYENLIEGFMLKRIMTSYDNLMGAHVRREAVEMLTGKKVSLLHNTFVFMKETFRQIERRITQGHLGPKAVQELLDYQQGLANKVSVSWFGKWYNPKSWFRKSYYHKLKDKEKFRQVLFSPQNHEETALAEIIWNSTKLQNLVQDEHLAKFARRAFRELNRVKKGRRKNLDDLDLSFRLIRIQMASGRPEMLQ